ncbi:hypothetical protein SO802_035523 [Lithocarpus litseifolius]|uniref:Uncharacterized protein n=1 Tax=Lithocarpus litseifolius TaxID=425828 RepID=A0AAW2B9C6_9ROSI
MNGAKRSAEAVGCKKASVGERSALEGSTRESSGGRSGSENVGLSNATLVRIQCPENLRVPPQGSSTEGESGPKIRPKGVVDGQQCRKVKEVGDLMTGEPATEAPVNGGRNYNGPKVAKFLVGLIFPRAHIDGKVWHLDVGSSPPGAVVCSKGWAVRPLKRYVSWVQNVVRQFGPYPVWALEH